jgi:hypothetical protein
MSSSQKTQTGKASGCENLSENPDSGMSLKEARRHLGIDVTERQFRRYVNEGVMPAAKLAKDSRGWWVFVSPPKTEKGWQQLAARIQKWRESRYERGWSHRPKKKFSRQNKLNANDRSVGLVTIESIHMDFLLWHRKVREDAGFPAQWDSRRLAMVKELLAPMVAVDKEISHQGKSSSHPTQRR